MCQTWADGGSDDLPRQPERSSPGHDSRGSILKDEDSDLSRRMWPFAGRPGQQLPIRATAEGRTYGRPVLSYSTPGLMQIAY